MPEWEGHERAEALIKASGIRVDHVAGDRANYSVKDDRVVLPDRSQSESSHVTRRRVVSTGPPADA